MLLRSLAAAAVAAVALPTAAQAADPAGTFTMVVLDGEGTLHVVSQPDARQPPATPNNVHVRVAGGEVRIVDGGDDVRPVSVTCRKVGAQEAACPLGSTRRIAARLDTGRDSGGDDIWRSDTSLLTTVDAGPGDDTVGRGLFTGFSRLDVRGGAGTDRVDYVLSPGGVTVTKDGVANDGRPGVDADNIRADVEYLMGSQFGDSLNGSADPSVIETFDGWLGADVLSGNAGSDRFVMGPAADGADQVFGGAGFDAALYSQRTRPVTINLSDGGADDGEAGEGDELRQVEAGAGGSAADTLEAHPASPVGVQLNGNAGDDTITGTNANGPCCEVDDTLMGGPGRDTISALAGDDAVNVRDGAIDTVSCGAGFDGIFGDAGEIMTGCENVQVGRLALAAKGEAVRLSWRHPRAWRELRAIGLRVLDGGLEVGRVTIDVRARRFSADGAVRLASRSLVTKGTRAVARMRLEVGPGLAGRRLELAVDAVDRRGRRQLEPAAGVLRAGR